MNDIFQDIKTAELHTCNTIKIITTLQNTIQKLNQDDDASNIGFSRFEEETEYLKKLTLKVANDLTPPVPNSSSISLATKHNKTKSKTSVIDSTPKFIKAKPKIMMSEKLQQTCDRRILKAHHNGTKPKNQSGLIHNKKIKFKKEVELIKMGSKSLSNHMFYNDISLKPTKYLQHILIPVNLNSISKEIIPSNWQHDGNKFIYTNRCSENQLPKLQVAKRKSGIENFAKMMQLCMNVKEERELDLEKQIYNLEAEMQVVMESNKSLYSALEKLEENNKTKKLLKDSSTLTDIAIPKKENSWTDLLLDKPTSEQITNALTEDIINHIHADIREITSNIAKTKSRSRLVFREHETIDKSKYELGKHVSFLEQAIVSMQNKLESAQNKQVELAIQSKAVVEAAHRMTNKPWKY